MSTCCLYGFKKRGVLKLDYNHYDSYLSGFGNKLLLFLKSNSIKELNNVFDKIVLVDGKSYPNEEQIREMKEKKIEYINYDNNSLLNFSDICYLNKFINSYIKDFYYMIDYKDSLDFIYDYLYIINLDNNKLEIYIYSSENKCEYGSYEIKQVYDLNNLPKRFI